MIKLHYIDPSLLNSGRYILIIHSIKRNRIHTTDTSDHAINLGTILRDSLCWLTGGYFFSTIVCMSCLATEEVLLATIAVSIHLVIIMLVEDWFFNVVVLSGKKIDKIFDMFMYSNTNMLSIWVL